MVSLLINRLLKAAMDFILWYYNKGVKYMPHFTDIFFFKQTKNNFEDMVSLPPPDKRHLSLRL